MRQVVEIHVPRFVEIIPERVSNALKRKFTPDEDDFLLRSRAEGMSWRNLGIALRCDFHTAQNRWRELQ